MEKLATRVMRKLSTPSTEVMAVTDHRKASEVMLRLRDALLAGEEASAKVRMCLTCAGVSIQRRVAFSDATAHANGVHDQFVTTMGLLFALIVMCNGEPTRTQEEEEEDDCDDMETGEGGEGEGEETVRVPLRERNARERAIALATWEQGTVEGELRAADGAETSSWASAIRSPTTLCQHCLVDAAERCHSLTLGELGNMGALFFRASAQALAVSLLDGAGRPSDDATSFLSLDVMTYVAEASNNLNERLMGIADCAESEAGQTVRTHAGAAIRCPRVRTCSPRYGAFAGPP